MKKALIGCLMVLVAGCGSPKPEHADSSNSPQSQPIVQNSEVPESVGEPESLAELLQKLVNSAQSLEKERKFAEAIGVWDRVIAELEQEYGVSSWESANAKLARATAQLQVHFNSAQFAQLESIADLQQQMAAAIGQQEQRIATRLAQDSVGISETLFGVDSPVTAKQRYQLAKLLKDEGRHRDAAFQYEKALEDLQTGFAPNHPDLVAIHEELGQMYLSASNFQVGIEHRKAATRMAGAIWGEDSLQYARRANELGMAFYQSGDAAMALRMFQAVEVIRRQKLGPDHPQVGHSFLNMATAMLESDRSRAEQAAGFYGRAAQIFSSSPDTVALQEQAWEKQATAYMLANQPERAEPLLAELVVRAQQQPSPSTTRIADLEYRYAIALGRQGKYELAEPVIKRVVAVQERERGPHHSQTERAYQAYALMLKQTGQTELSEQLMNRLRFAQNPDSGEFQPTIR